MMSFDAAGLEVSSGSACSSGANIPSRILGHLNYDRKQSMAGIRLSFCPSVSEEEKQQIKTSVIEVLRKFYPL